MTSNGKTEVEHSIKVSFSIVNLTLTYLKKITVSNFTNIYIKVNTTGNSFKKNIQLIN